MEEENIRNKLRHIAGAMDGFTLETLKIATVQAELVEVKEEIRILQGQNETTLGKVSRLENENVLKGDLDILKSQNNTLKGEMVILKEENNGLKNIVNGLQKDFQIFKSRDGIYKYIYKNFPYLETFFRYRCASQQRTRI